MLRLFVLVCALLVVVPAPAAGPRARSANSLERAKKQFDRLRYREALPLLLKAVDDPAVSIDERREALALLGTVQVILDDEPGARASFSRLLREDPDHRLEPNLSPKILDVFEAVRRELSPPLQVRILQAPTVVETGPTGIAAETVVQQQGEGAITVLLELRERHEKGFTAVPMQSLEGGRYRCDLGLRPVAGQAARQVEYRLHVVGPDGKDLALGGDEASPGMLDVAPSPAPATVASEGTLPWPWVGAGVGLLVVAAGVAVTTAVMLNLPPAETPSSLGTYTLE
ncbi:MAG: hypothetical protein ABIJ09_20720 [Pseudomonadota bacterium]